MTREEAYKHMILSGKIVKHKGKLRERPSLSQMVGSTTWPIECYYKYSGPNYIYWSVDPELPHHRWNLCTVYDPIFLDDSPAYEWSIYGDKA